MPKYSSHTRRRTENKSTHTHTLFSSFLFVSMPLRLCSLLHSFAVIRESQSCLSPNKHQSRDGTATTATDKNVNTKKRLLVFCGKPIWKSDCSSKWLEKNQYYKWFFFIKMSSHINYERFDDGDIHSKVFPSVFSVFSTMSPFVSCWRIKFAAYFGRDAKTQLIHDFAMR